MDLGECTKIHDLALRADYEIASKERDLFFELDVSDGLLPQWCFGQVCRLQWSTVSDELISKCRHSVFFPPIGSGPSGVVHCRVWPKDRTRQETPSWDPRRDQCWGGSKGKLFIFLFACIKNKSPVIQLVEPRLWFQSLLTVKMQNM